MSVGGHKNGLAKIVSNKGKEKYQPKFIIPDDFFFNSLLLIFDVILIF
jgi:hypothetical protein